MIATDTSSFVAYLQGEKGPDVEAVDQGLDAQLLMLPPVVLTELLSDDCLNSTVRNHLLALPLLKTFHGYWERAGVTRSRLLSRNLKARVGDALIAQACIDQGIALITRDKDFRHFEKYAGLKLVGLA